MSIPNVHTHEMVLHTHKIIVYKIYSYKRFRTRSKDFVLQQNIVYLYKLYVRKQNKFVHVHVHIL